MTDSSSVSSDSSSSKSTHSNHTNSSNSSSNSSSSSSNSSSSKSSHSETESSVSSKHEILIEEEPTPSFQHPLLIDQIKRTPSINNPFIASYLFTDRSLDLDDSRVNVVSTTSTEFICAKCHEKSRIHYQEAIKCKACGFRIMHKERDPVIKPILTAGYGYKFDH